MPASAQRHCAQPVLYFLLTWGGGVAVILETHVGFYIPVFLTSLSEACAARMLCRNPGYDTHGSLHLLCHMLCSIALVAAVIVSSLFRLLLSWPQPVLLASNFDPSLGRIHGSLHCGCDNTVLFACALCLRAPPGTRAHTILPHGRRTQLVLQWPTSYPPPPLPPPPSAYTIFIAHILLNHTFPACDVYPSYLMVHHPLSSTNATLSHRRGWSLPIRNSRRSTIQRRPASVGVRLSLLGRPCHQLRAALYCSDPFSNFPLPTVPSLISRP